MSLISKLIGEARPSQAFELVRKISKLDGYQSVDSWSQADGYSILLKDETGQAYEVQVRPAAYAKHPSLNQFYGTGRGTG